MLMLSTLFCLSVGGIAAMYKRYGSQVFSKNFEKAKIDYFQMFKVIVWAISSYDGFNSVNFITYKIENMGNLRLAVTMSLCIETFFYIFICFSFFTVIPYKTLTNKDNEIQLVTLFINELFKNYSDSEFKKWGLYLGPKIISIVPTLGILNGCLIIMKSIFSYFTKKANYMMVFMSFVIFSMSFFDTDVLLTAASFTVNFWYSLSILTLLLKYKREKIHKSKLLLWGI